MLRRGASSAAARSQRPHARSDGRDDGGRRAAAIAIVRARARCRRRRPRSGSRTSSRRRPRACPCFETSPSRCDAGEIVGIAGGRRQRTGRAGRGAGRPARAARAASRRVAARDYQGDARRRSASARCAACPRSRCATRALPRCRWRRTWRSARSTRPPFAIGRLGLSQAARFAQRAQALIGDFGIRTPSADAPIGKLSGGNVQRAVLARELEETCAC